MVLAIFILTSLLGFVASLPYNETSLLITPGFSLPTVTTTFIEIVTETITPTLTASSSADLPSSTPLEPTLTSWTSPSRFMDISEAFGVTKFADNRKNLQVVDLIPPEATDLLSTLYVDAQAPFGPHLFEADDPTNSNGLESESILQVFYPEGSVNPANSPRGGAQFYASPIDITSANNVTFAYSILFPKRFNFVRGGKLPGLYGGRAGCSGGDAATTCFSTRMMWRKDGQGELYLYAPKDKQTTDLCNDPQSICDAAYGLSIGRGSFSYTPGKWTRVSQTVTLNTPGEQDGCFTLDVNGERVVDRKDVFYRDEVYYNSESTNKKPQGRKKKTKEQTQKSSHRPEGGLLGLGGVLRRDEPSLDELFIQDDGETMGIQETSEPGPIGFIGIFFSTFFGGHGPEWASPRDQYAWFKDFAVLYNA